MILEHETQSCITKTAPSLCTFTLAGSAVATPITGVTSEELDQQHHLKPGSCQKSSGVHHRYQARDESVSGLAATAVQKALQQAHRSFGSLDALIYCGASREQGIPCTAVKIQQKLGEGSSGVSCFDIDATCLSFLRAMEVATRLLQSGAYQSIMVVSSEIPSRFLDPTDTKTLSLFGDGAAAFLFSTRKSAAPSWHLQAARFATYSTCADACEIRGGGSAQPAMSYTTAQHQDFLFQMKGRQLVKQTLKYLPGFLNKFFAEQQTHMQEIDWVIPHQASHTAMKLIGDRIGLIPQKTVSILAQYGNQVSASIPTAFSIALQDKRIQPGDRVLLLGTGAGLGIGALLLEWSRS